jgi:hypothetical protein
VHPLASPGAPPEAAQQDIATLQAKPCYTLLGRARYASPESLPQRGGCAKSNSAEMFRCALLF